MKISENGLKLIRSFEGCRLEAYKCPAGVWTIGWGHTGNVKAGQRITQAEADKMLTDDMGPYERNVDKYGTKYMWNQNEFDALVSFAYNVGSIDQQKEPDRGLRYQKRSWHITAVVVRFWLA